MTTVALANLQIQIMGPTEQVLDCLVIVQNHLDSKERKYRTFREDREKQLASVLDYVCVETEDCDTTDYRVIPNCGPTLEEMGQTIEGR